MQAWPPPSLHAPCPLARWLVGVCRSVMEVPVFAVLHPRKHLLLRCTVAVRRCSELWIVVGVVMAWILPGSVVVRGCAMLLPAAIL